jgi:hypothetical protein
MWLSGTVKTLFTNKDVVKEVAKDVRGQAAERRKGQLLYLADAVPTERQNLCGRADGCFYPEGDPVRA